MSSKVEILMHPVRMKICQVLMRHREKGLTPLEMVKIIEDVPQATLYRHIQIMVNAGVIHVVNEKKVKSVSEKYYSINEDEAKLDMNEWQKATHEEKLNYISYYHLSLMTQYQAYLKKLEKQKDKEDRATFSVVELNMDEELFSQFQNDLNDLMIKYYHSTSKNENTDAPARTIALTIIPDS